MTSSFQAVRAETFEEQLDDLPKGLSFFDPILPHEVKETLEAGGEVFISQNSKGDKTGLFIYDNYETTGTIFTKSRDVFNQFYSLKPGSYIFSELDAAEYEKEVWNTSGHWVPRMHEVSALADKYHWSKCQLQEAPTIPTKIANNAASLKCTAPKTIEVPPSIFRTYKSNLSNSLGTYNVFLAFGSNVEFLYR